MNLFDLFIRVAVDDSGVNTSLQNITAGVGKVTAAANTMALGFLAAMGAIAVSTRDSREINNSLVTAFESVGYSAETAGAAAKDFYMILGEEDQAIEAVSHLAQLVNTEKELATWTDIAAGVFAKFGDSLPLEGLTEAASVTATLGEVTGPLVDAFEFAGINIEKFNGRLERVSNVGKRAEMITTELNKIYGETGRVFQETNKDIHDARDAQYELGNAMNEFGAIAEPILTKVVIAVTKLLNFILDNQEPVIAALKLISIGLIGLNVVNMILKLTAAFTAFNAVLLANPIALTVVAIGGLVAALGFLWSASDDFRNLVIGIFESIKKAGVTLYNWFTKTFFEDIPNAITDFVEGAIETVQGLIDFFLSIPVTLFNIGKEMIIGLVEGIASMIAWAAESIGRFFGGIFGFFGDAWGGIKHDFGEMFSGFGGGRSSFTFSSPTGGNTFNTFSTSNNIDSRSIQSVADYARVIENSTRTNRMK